MMYKVLDLFCKAGGAAKGLKDAWQDAEIIGVDIEMQKNYPFTFVQADALNLPFDLDWFDFIWASPPCQDYSTLQSLTTKQYPRLIEPVRKMLKASGKPYSIENVKGARYELDNPLMLCGTMFNLRVLRHRYFECNPPILLAPYSCNHWGKCDSTSGDMRKKARASGTFIRTKAQSFATADFLTIAGRDFLIDDARRAMGIDWMSAPELREAIPPAYSEYIARQIRPMETLDNSW